MKKFLQSNETRYRLLRTIFQGMIGVIIANADFLLSGLNLSPGTKTFIVALVMAILSPIMSELGNSETDNGDDFYNEFMEVDNDEETDNEAEQ